MNAWREYATVGRGLPLSISDCVGNVTNPISCNSAIIFEFEFHTADAGLRCQGEEDSMTKYQCTIYLLLDACGDLCVLKNQN